MRLFILSLSVILGIGLCLPVAAKASGGTEHSPKLHWPFEGVFGTFDKAALQRGYKVYREVCSSCHSMNKVYFRNLADLGYSDEQIKQAASEYTFTDGPNEEGDMFERPGLASDRFKAPFENVQQAAYANNGAAPPDMSLLAKARHGGADYIYAILTGYEDAPHGHKLMPGQYWNRYMNGNVIAMPPPLADGQVSYDDGSYETLEQYAQDVASFLTWASDPKMEERKRTGVMAFLFLLVFSGILYAVKKKVWADQH